MFTDSQLRSDTSFISTGEAVVVPFASHDATLAAIDDAYLAWESAYLATPRNRDLCARLGAEDDRLRDAYNAALQAHAATWRKPAIQTARKSGEVMWYSPAKGHGYIASDGDSFYFEACNINSGTSIEDGDIVTFQVVSNLNEDGSAGTATLIEMSSSPIETAPQGDLSPIAQASDEIVTQADLQPAARLSKSRYTGEVTFYNAEKGYGAIQSDDYGDTLYVRAGCIARGSTLKQGDKVTFRAVESTGEYTSQARAEGVIVEGYTAPARVRTLGPMAQAAKQAVQDARDAKRNASKIAQ